MKDEEKNLIENLFHRLKKTELNSSEKDISADNLIQKLVKQQPTASYYMVQTILIQETAIKKMSLKIDELTQRIKSLNKEESNNKPSFLSNFFKKNPTSQTMCNDNNVWKKKEDLTHLNSSAYPATQTIPTVINSSRSSGFLSNALQTATGVAGGMILGNMLMNVFNHSKPEEEIFDNIHKYSTENNIEDNSTNHVNQNNLINHEYNESNVDLNESIPDHAIYDIDENDFNDDNLI